MNTKPNRRDIFLNYKSSNLSLTRRLISFVVITVIAICVYSSTQLVHATEWNSLTPPNEPREHLLTPDMRGNAIDQHFFVHVMPITMMKPKNFRGVIATIAISPPKSTIYDIQFQLVHQDSCRYNGPELPPEKYDHIEYSPVFSLPTPNGTLDKGQGYIIPTDMSPEAQQQSPFAHFHSSWFAITNFYTMRDNQDVVGEVLAFKSHCQLHSSDDYNYDASMKIGMIISGTFKPFGCLPMRKPIGTKELSFPAPAPMNIEGKAGQRNTIDIPKGW